MMNIYQYLLENLYGGRDCILDVGRRERKIQELRSRYSGRKLSRAIPYTLNVAPIYAEKRIRRLPKYLKDFHTRGELERMVESLTELKRIKDEYRPRKKHLSDEERTISKARSKIRKGKAIRREDLDDYDEALELDDTGDLYREMEDAHYRREAKAYEDEQRHRQKIAKNVAKFKKFYKRAWNQVLKQSQPRTSQTRRNHEIAEIMSNLGTDEDIEESYFGLLRNGFTYKDILRLVYDDYK